MARPPAHRRRDSRALVLRAARTEFAAQGFNGAGVDRIARRARVNKAMIYYHFGSKLELYREVVRDGFRMLALNARAALAPHDSAADQLDAYVASLLHTSREHPYLVPMMLREVAGGGQHLDPDTLQPMLGMFQIVHEILDRGRERGELEAADPVLTHLLITGATLLYVANEPMRLRIRQLRLPGGPRNVPVGEGPFRRHLSHVLRRTLCTPRSKDAPDV
jgi:TetR/AcrR family transcriptional regulator